MTDENHLGIGMVIGHEITHGFDDDGRQYDKYGNRVPWWSNSTIDEFNKRKQCIIDQYSNYTVEQIGRKVSPALSISFSRSRAAFFSLLVEW